MLKGRSKETTLEQKSSVNALGVVNIGGVFVVLLVGLAFAVMVAIGAEFVVPFSSRSQVDMKKSSNDPLFRSEVNKPRIQLWFARPKWNMDMKIIFLA